MNSNIEKQIEQNVLDANFSLADLHVIQQEIRRGAYPQTKDYFALHVIVNHQISARIMRLVESRESIDILQPTYYEDDEPCGYCGREIGTPHKPNCRQ